MWSSSIEREEINELRVVLKAPVTKKNLVLFHLSKMNSPTLDTVLLGQYLTQTWTQSVNRHAWLSFKIVGTLLCFSLVCNTINFSVIFSWGTSSSTCILYTLLYSNFPGNHCLLCCSFLIFPSQLLHSLCSRCHFSMTLMIPIVLLNLFCILAYFREFTVFCSLRS